MSGSLFPDALKQLLEEFSRSGIRELHVRKADFELYLSTDPAAGRSQPVAAPPAVTAAPSPTPEAAAPAAPPPASASAGSLDLPENAVVIRAPNLGTFYRAPKPGAANYVEIGSKVKTGDELSLIEVMKLFTALRAEEDGTIHAILVEDGAMVEGGQPLFVLVRD